MKTTFTRNHSLLSLIPLLIILVPSLPPAHAQPVAQEAKPDASAEFVVTETVLRPAAKVAPLGANAWGGCGAVEWAANNFVHNSGNEPIYWRNLHRVMNCGPNWFEIDGPGTSWWDLWASGFLSGASLRIYRLVDKDGNPLPPEGNYQDLGKADHVAFVGKAKIISEGAKGFPYGGWIANRYADVFPNAWIRHGNLATTDASGVENGKSYWYTLTAISADNQESDASSEVIATPKAGIETSPHVLIGGNDDKTPEARPGAWFDLAPGVCGGKAPYRWEILDAQGNPSPGLLTVQGLKLDSATGRIMGNCTGGADNLRFQLRVTDTEDRSDTRGYVLNPQLPADKGKPQPPQEVKAVAGDGCVTLTWKPSPSTNVVAYRLKRSWAPAAEQLQRVFTEDGAPPLQKFDYVVLEKRFDPFDMKYVNSRVRGIGNPMDSPGWFWNTDLNQVKLSLVPHPKPVPDEMLDPGEACLQVKTIPGQHTINQIVFIATDKGYESIWYGQLEPGKQYRLEVWLRQEGLGDGGNVTFHYTRAEENGYAGIRQTFPVTSEWRRYTYDFVGPERPKSGWHFGHAFTFTGPGTLWMDNCRIFRCDKPEDAAKPYTPNPVVLDELLASQPTKGPKGAHRIWFLSRDATMKSLLSWHASSQVRPDWSTRVERTMDMTLPMGLMFDLQTGSDPQTRMRPWLVLQHILHSENDWLGFIQYLAAPYDPKKDSAQTKPWAHLRYQQRGIGTPWTDEFAEIIVEFGNETWHNGIFDDWIGFRTRNAVHQGGPEYGFFCRYLIETMKKSPYRKSENLDRKIRFCLGANYDGRIDPDGKVRGYGEEAMQTCPEAACLGHANYVGPKWETGDKSEGVFDDHGVQGTLLGFVAGPEESQKRMGAALNALEKVRPRYDIVAYEGGPSGYALPGRDSPEQKLVNEKYGKSLAMGVAALDAWMRSYQYGWTYQNFLGYGQGLYWNSHTPMWDGFRPCPGWQALALRNRVASGDLMAVEERSVPTIPWDKKVYPLIGAYAMRGGNRWSVILLRRP